MGGSEGARQHAGESTSGQTSSSRWLNVPALRGDKLETINASSWNTRHLGKRVCADMIAALGAGALVAPLITMIDRSVSLPNVALQQVAYIALSAIIENASNKATISASVRRSSAKLLFQPHRFLFSKPFALVLLLYSGTYFAANSVDTISSMTRDRSAADVTSGSAKFAATSVTNLSLCLYKDSNFTRIFGARSVPRPIPIPTYALYAMRDCLTIFASFNVPPLLAPHLPLDAIPALSRYIGNASAAQFIAPAAIQVFSTPLHLLGLDMYNRSHVTWAQRWSKVKTEWVPTTFARMCRIVPAFGVGGVVNADVRRRCMESIGQ